MIDYYFYKQTGFNAVEREEIQSNFKPFEMLTRYQPKNFDLPIVSNEQVEKYKSELIKKAKEKNFELKFNEQDYYYLTQCNEIKQKAEYFLIGKFDKVNGKLGTKTKDFHNKQLAVLDYEYLSLDTEEFYNLIQSKLANYSYMIYKSVSYTKIHPRFRLIVDTSKGMNEQEYKATIKSIVDLIGVEPDTASFKYIQIQGLPLTINDGEYKPIINHSNPYPVQEAVKEEKKVITTYTSEPIQNFTKVSHNQAISIMKKYVENEQDKLKERNDYYLSCLTVIAKSVVIGEIEYDTAIECMEMLALGNDEWKVNNLNELNGEIARANGNVFYFKNKYTFLGKFQKTQQKMQVSNLTNNDILEIAIDEKGKPINSLQNIEKMVLSTVPIAYNEFTQTIEVIFDEKKIEYGDDESELLRMEIEKRFNLKVKKVDLQTAVVCAGYKFKYHPIKTKILSEDWDGIPRAESFFIDILGVEDNIYNRECSRKWLLAGVYRIFEPGTKFDEMLIIHGEQGLSKSTTFERLSLKSYVSETEKISLETLIKMEQKWIIDFTELATMKKTDIDTFKAWLSETSDTYRGKYDKRARVHERHFIICGTTNDKEILTDRTGNRRYWIMYGEVERRKLDIFDVTDEYILQLWSEVYQWYLKKETLLISVDTKNYMRKITSVALEYDPLEEKINSILEMILPNNWIDFFNTNTGRFKIYNYVKEFISFGVADESFLQETKIQDITSYELAFLLGEGEEFKTNLGGSKLAKDINRVMNNLPNWTKTNKVTRNGKKLNGYVRNDKKV